MRLGISYNVFEGEELLACAIKQIRNNIDFISVVYQQISYFGNKANNSLLETLILLQKENYIDELIEHKNDASYTPRENEINARNKGLQSSIRNGCTHHISADTDEFYEDIEFVKNKMKNYKSSVVYLENYYKCSKYQIVPSQNHQTSFIHSVDLYYKMVKDYPYKIDMTRRLNNTENCIVFSKQEFVIHHMSYVRKNIENKIYNSGNWIVGNKEKFVEEYKLYKLGDKLKIPPDFNIRRTKFVENNFLRGEKWEQLP